MTGRAAAIAWRLFELNWIVLALMCGAFALVVGLSDFSLELARGTYHVGYYDENGVFRPLVGEMTVSGEDWDGSTWRTAAFTSSTWRNEVFDSSTWRGDWAGSTWRVFGWAGSTWRDVSWSSSTWRWA